MPALKPIFNYLAKHLSTYFDLCYSSKHFRTCLCATWTGWKRCLSVCWMGEVYKVRTLRGSCLNTMIRDAKNVHLCQHCKDLRPELSPQQCKCPPPLPPICFGHISHTVFSWFCSQIDFCVCLCNFSVTSPACLTLQSFWEAISHAVWCGNKSPWS